MEIEIVKPRIWNFKVVNGKDAWKEVVESARLSGVPTTIKDKKVFLMMVKNDYGSILEHIIIKFDIQMSKGNAPELLEHRIASHSGWSTRYINAEYEVIVPWEYLSLPENNIKRVSSLSSAKRAIEAYEHELKDLGARRESARYNLPFAHASAKYHFTINLRSLLNLLNLRLCVRASPEFRCIASQLYFELLKVLPDIRGLVGCRGFRPRSCSESKVTGVREGKTIEGYPPCIFRNQKSNIYIPTEEELEQGGFFLKKFERQKATELQEKIFKKWAEWEG